MERFKKLNRFQKGILLLLAAMVAVFSAVYPYVISRKGFLYRDTILIPSQKNGDTIYSGTISGEEAAFTVFADRTIQFTYGTTPYGPYLVREAPDAVPQDPVLSDMLIGIEIICDDELLFRGGAMYMDDGETHLFGEDGRIESVDLGVSYGDGTVTMYDENGHQIDPMAPSATTIFTLYCGPVLTHKGVGLAWFGGVFLCVLAAFTILYAEELFQWNLSFRIKNTEQAEPSDWEIGSRYLQWILFPILALAIFMMGLQ